MITRILMISRTLSCLRICILWERLWWLFSTWSSPSWVTTTSPILSLTVFSILLWNSTALELGLFSPPTSWWSKSIIYRRSLGAQTTSMQDAWWRQWGHMVGVDRNKACSRSWSEIWAKLQGEGLLDGHWHQNHWRIILWHFLGVGLPLSNKEVFNQASWKGENHLGKALMEVRTKLQKTDW